MKFLFNKSDNSYNCHSEYAFRPEMICDRVYEVELDVDISAYKDITLTEYNKETGELVDLSDFHIPINAYGRQLLIEKIAEQLEFITPDSHPEEYERIRAHAAIILLPEQYDAIFEDGVIDAEEMQTLLDASS